MFKYVRVAFAAMFCVLASAAYAFAKDFDIPAGNLRTVLRTYMSQAGVQLM